MNYDKIGTTDNLESDEDEIDLAPKEGVSSKRKKHTSRQFMIILVAEHVVLATLFLICWNSFVPPRTSLHNQVLTVDNKSFPSGQLSWSQHFEPLPCGATPEEAKDRGCHFDMISTAWLPPRCIDYELVDEFMKLGNWQFYTEMHGTTKHKSYEPDVLGSHSTPRTIWTTRAWHHMHCLYVWRKMGRALVKGTPADSEAVSDPHTNHCMKSLEDLVFGPHRNPDEVEVYVEVIYPPC